MNWNMRYPRPALVLIALLASGHLASAATAESHPLDDIRETARAYLAGEAGDGQRGVEVEVGRLDPRLRLKRCETPLAAYLAPGARTSGHTSVGVRCDGATPWTLFVPAIVRHEYGVVVAARPIARGEIVGADALDSATRLLPSAPAGLISDPASAVGRAAVRDIAVGTLLSSNLIKSPQTIRRGQSVTLSLASGAVAVRVAGTALRDGALGERIPVRNLNSKRVVEGVILDAGVVEVAAGRPAAMQR
jgi:flagella basal body P-ring formation protein FlgA